MNMHAFVLPEMARPTDSTMEPPQHEQFSATPAQRLSETGQQHERPNNDTPGTTSPLAEPDYEGARRYAIDRLTLDLSPLLQYHNLAHTLDEVLPAVEECAAAEGVGGDALCMLRTAALFQDVGFAEQWNDHELASVRMVESTLPHYGYTDVQVQCIANIILASRIGQKPRLSLAQLLADANHDLFGRPTFLMRMFDLRRELASFGTVMVDDVWYANLLTCVREHRYWRPSMERRHAAQKQQNMATLTYLLHHGLPQHPPQSTPLA